MDIASDISDNPVQTRNEKGASKSATNGESGGAARYVLTAETIEQFERHYNRKGSLEERQTWLTLNAGKACHHCKEASVPCRDQGDNICCAPCRRRAKRCSRVADERRERIMEEMNINVLTYKNLLNRFERMKGLSISGSTPTRKPGAVPNRTGGKTGNPMPIVKIRPTRKTPPEASLIPSSRSTSPYLPVRRDRNPTKSPTKAQAERTTNVKPETPPPPFPASESALTRKRTTFEGVVLASRFSSSRDIAQQSQKALERSPASRRSEQAKKAPKSPTGVEQGPRRDKPGVQRQTGMTPQETFVELHILKRTLEMSMDGVPRKSNLWNTLNQVAGKLGDMAATHIDAIMKPDTSRDGTLGRVSVDLDIDTEENYEEEDLEQPRKRRKVA